MGRKKLDHKWWRHQDMAVCLSEVWRLRYDVITCRFIYEILESRSLQRETFTVKTKRNKEEFQSNANCLLRPSWTRGQFQGSVQGGLGQGHVQRNGRGRQTDRQTDMTENITFTIPLEGCNKWVLNWSSKQDNYKVGLTAWPITSIMLSFVAPFNNRNDTHPTTWLS